MRHASGLVLILAVCSCMLAAQAPTNDACANAIPVSDGVNPPSGPAIYSLQGATLDGSSSCFTLSPIFSPQDVWFSYTSTGTGVVTVSTDVPAGHAWSFSNVNAMSVRAGCGGPEVACVQGRTLTFIASIGTQYAIRVATSGIGMPGYFFVTVIPARPVPANDECTGATPLVPGTNGPFNNAAATTSAGSNPAWSDLWYSFTTGPCPESVTLEQCPSWQVYLDIFAACAGPVVASGAQNGTAPGCSLGAKVSMIAAANTTYLVRVKSIPGAADSYTLTLTLGAPLLLFSSPGTGCVQADLAGLPPGGLYMLAVTQVAGAFPSGAFFGIDIPMSELLAEFFAGAPFTGNADSCGNVHLGPACGLPSGGVLYAVTLGFVGAYAPPPATVSPPATWTIP